MRLLYELSWLWEMMGIAMAAAVVCGDRDFNAAGAAVAADFR